MKKLIEIISTKNVALINGTIEFYMHVGLGVPKFVIKTNLE